MRYRILIAAALPLVCGPAQAEGNLYIPQNPQHSPEPGISGVLLCPNRIPCGNARFFQVPNPGSNLPRQGSGPWEVIRQGTQWQLCLQGQRVGCLTGLYLKAAGE